MHRTFSGKEISYCEDGSFFGINLGADATSEHEWGIAGLVRKFNVDTSILGVDGRQTKTLSGCLHFGDIKIDQTQYTYLLCLRRDDYLEYYDGVVSEKLICDCELRPYKDENIWAAWDESSFGILVTEKHKRDIESLYNAFKSCDVVLGVGAGVFMSGGLKLVICSKMTEEQKSAILLSDVSKIRLKIAAEETGIYKLLEKAGKKYFALSPRWKDDNETEIIFWLNPWEQQKYNFGWFTIEDLKEWAKDQGKIMMKTKR